MEKFNLKGTASGVFKPKEEKEEEKKNKDRSD